MHPDLLPFLALLLTGVVTSATIFGVSKPLAIAFACISALPLVAVYSNSGSGFLPTKLEFSIFYATPIALIAIILGVISRRQSRDRHSILFFIFSGITAFLAAGIAAVVAILIRIPT